MKRTSNDSWYESLDGRLVGQATGGWQLRVFSIVAEFGRTWVQVALSGATTYNVLLRVNRSADVADAIWAVEQWLDRPSAGSDRIIDVRGSISLADPTAGERVHIRARRVNPKPNPHGPRLLTV